MFRVDVRKNATNEIDAIWVRRWKDRKLKIIKSRICGRGFLDRQKTQVLRHSSTASRLSHRLALQLALQYGYELESLDVCTAFLQGLTFADASKKAKALGFDHSVTV